MLGHSKWLSDSGPDDQVDNIQIGMRTGGNCYLPYKRHIWW